MITFSYTKANGETSERVAVIVDAPRPNYMMFDLTEYSEEERAAFGKAYRELEAKVDALYKELPFKAPLKAFKKEGISNIEVVISE